MKWLLAIFYLAAISYGIVACTTGDDDDDEDVVGQAINDYCYQVQECDEYQNVDICIAQMEQDECNTGEAYATCLKNCLDQSNLDCEDMVECEWDCSATDPC